MGTATDLATEGPEPSQSAPYVLDFGKPGEADCGRGVDQALEVINALESHGISCCVAGTKALIYYGAHRVPVVSYSSRI